MTAQHSRVRISRKATLAFGALAVGTMVLAPSVANADPQPTVEQVKAQLDKLYQDAADANEAYNAAQVAKQQLQTQIAGINAQMPQQQAGISDTQSQLGAIAAAQYRAGGSGIDPTIQLMMQSDPKSVLALAGAVDRASQLNADALRVYTQVKADLKAEGQDAGAKLVLLDKSTKDA